MPAQNDDSATFTRQLLGIVLRKRPPVRSWKHHPNILTVCLRFISKRGNRTKDRLSLHYHAGPASIRHIIDHFVTILREVAHIVHLHGEKPFFLASLEHAVSQHRGEHPGKQCQHIEPQHANHLIRRSTGRSFFEPSGRRYEPVLWLRESRFLWLLVEQQTENFPTSPRHPPAPRSAGS